MTSTDAKVLARRLGIVATVGGAASLGIGLFLRHRGLTQRADGPGDLPTVDRANPPAAGAMPQAGLPSPDGGASLQWSLASIVLASVPDPYNPPERLQAFLARNSGKAREARLAESKEVGGLFSAIRSATASSTAGFSIVDGLTNWIGDLVNKNSHGGFDDLSLLARQRIALYELVPDLYFADSSKWNSRKVPIEYAPNAPLRLPPQVSDLSAWRSSAEAAVESWAMYRMRTLGYAAEVLRVSRTADEPMLPAALIRLLSEAKEWPPPVEPVPLDFMQFRRRFRAPHPLADWSYVDFDQAVLQYPEACTRAEAKAAAAYDSDAAAFGARISAIGLGAELRELASSSGCIPELGSRANPVRRVRGGNL